MIISLVLIVISPSMMGVDAPTVAKASRHLIQAPPIFPLGDPGILSAFRWRAASTAMRNASLSSMGFVPTLVLVAKKVIAH